MAESIPQAITPFPRFHVQVGVFDERDDARRLVKHLESLGYAAALEDGSVYRVWVGGYLDRETAERLVANVRRAGLDPVLVP